MLWQLIQRELCSRRMVLKAVLNNMQSFTQKDEGRWLKKIVYCLRGLAGAYCTLKELNTTCYCTVLQYFPNVPEKKTSYSYLLYCTFSLSAEGRSLVSFYWPKSKERKPIPAVECNWPTRNFQGSYRSCKFWVLQPSSSPSMINRPYSMILLQKRQDEWSWKKSTQILHDIIKHSFQRWAISERSSGISSGLSCSTRSLRCLKRPRALLYPSFWRPTSVFSFACTHPNRPVSSSVGYKSAFEIAHL